MAVVRQVKKKFDRLKPRLRVAAYARVSVDTDRLLHSLSTQVEYYKKLIEGNMEWEYAGVYVDEGITGTRMDIRAGFRQMIESCERGEIDLILVKSISRFSRNTLDCLETVRHLKELGIAVKFERENINSMSVEGELMLTLMASYAQEESRTISQNVKWRIRKRFEAGEQNGVKAPYGYIWDGEMYRVAVEQGEVVKEIFSRYLAGESAYGIAKDLAERGVCGNCGRPMEQTTVKEILSSFSYTGSKVLQKYYITDNHKRRDNLGELPKYVVEGMYEPLINVETFEKAQFMRRQRAERQANRDYIPTMLSGKVKCACCGGGVSRRSKSGKGKKWVCNAKERKGIAVCDLRDISEEELFAAAGKAVRSNDTLKQVVLYNDRIRFITEKGVVREIPRDFSGNRGFNAFSRKVYCSVCGNKCRRSKWSRGVMIWHCEKCHSTKVPEADMLKAATVLLGDRPEGKIVECVKKIIVKSGDIDFVTKEGELLSWQRK